MEHKQTPLKHAQIWQTVRILMAGALALLARADVRRFLRPAQAAMKQAETAVRAWLAEQAQEVDVPDAERRRKASPKSSQKDQNTLKLKNTRSFAVLPPGLPSISLPGDRAPLLPIASTWADQQSASLKRRAAQLRDVEARPDIYIQRLARAMARMQPVLLVLRYAGAGLPAPRADHQSYETAPARPPPFDDSS